MPKALDSYNEVGFLRPLWNKAKRIGVNPRYWLYRANWNLVKKFHYVTSFPIHIDIESTNFCNLKCSMCPHAIENFEMAKGFFDFDLYRKIIDEGAARGLSSVKLNIRGEPLLNKRLPEMVAYAKQKGILEVMFNTNGLLLTPDKTRELVAAGLDYLIVSIDGDTKATYDAIRKGGDFDTLVKNLEFFVAHRKEKRLQKPLIRLQYVEMEENTHEVQAYLNRWRDKVDVMTVNRYSNRGCGERQVHGMTPVGRANCPHPWRRMSIAWNGDAQICCGDWNNVCVLGNAKDHTLHSLWHGEKFKAYRKKLKALQLNDIPCCKDCFVLASYVWDKPKQA